MTMNAWTDVLDGGVPVRLLRGELSWTLEVESLARVTHSLFRMRRTRVRGEAAIREWLARESMSELLAATNRIFDASPAAGAVFQRDEAGWLDASDGPAASAESDAGQRIARLERDVAEVHGQIVQLKVELQRLRSLWAQEAAARIPRKTSSQDEPGDAAADARVAAPRAPERRDGPGAAAEIPRIAEPVAIERAADPAPAPVPEPESVSPPLRLPEPRALQDALETLLGTTVEVGVLEKRPRLEKAPGDYYACLLRDRSDAFVGALIADVVATCRLGGTLLLLPESTMSEGIETRSPAPDAVDATSEVFNTLSATFNSIAGNAHVRTIPLACLAERPIEWLSAARARLDLDLGPLGHLTLVAR
jgi:hypothetical protein